MVCPFNQKSFFYDLESIDYYFKNGIIHIHKVIAKMGAVYNIQHKEFNVNVPSTTKILKLWE
jgi:hypothetical protein